MERVTGLDIAREIMGMNFIGPDEILRHASKLGVKAPSAQRDEIPVIHYGHDLLERVARSHILVMTVPRAFDGRPLTLNAMRTFLGTDPSKSEPCFYDQDWYVREEFARTFESSASWHLVGRELLEFSKGLDPAAIHQGVQLPSALLAAFTFFSYYFVSGGDRLWEHEFIWCSDTDHNGDQVYVGRYSDPMGMNKSGFNIHRHLRLRKNYGAVEVIA